MTYSDETGTTKTGSLVFEVGRDEVASTKNLAEAINNDSVMGSHFKATVNDKNELVIESTVKAASADGIATTKGAATVVSVQITATDGTATKALQIANSTPTATSAKNLTTSSLWAFDSDGKLQDVTADAKLKAAINSGFTIYTEATLGDKASEGEDYSVIANVRYSLKDDTTLYDKNGSVIDTDSRLQSILDSGGTVYSTAPESVLNGIRSVSSANTITQTSAGRGLHDVIVQANSTIKADTYTWDEAKSVWSGSDAKYTSAEMNAMGVTFVTVDSAGFTNGDKFTIGADLVKKVSGVEAGASDYDATVSYDIQLKKNTTFYDAMGNELTEDEVKEALTPSFSIKAGTSLYNADGTQITTNSALEVAAARGDVYTSKPSMVTISSATVGGTGNDTGNSAVGPNVDKVTIASDADIMVGTYIYKDNMWLDSEGNGIDTSKIEVSVLNGKTLNSGTGASVQDYFVISQAVYDKVKGKKATESDYVKTVDDVYTSTPTLTEATTTTTSDTGSPATSADADIYIYYDPTGSTKIDGTGITESGDGKTASRTFDLSSLNDGDRVQINGKNYTYRENDSDVDGKNDFHNIDQLKAMSDAIGGSSLSEVTVYDQFQAGESLTLQVGDTNSDYQKVGVEIQDMSSTGLGLKGLDISTQENAAKAIDTIKTAINAVSTQRGKLGAMQNRLDHTLNNLDATTQNITASESQIRDVDMAREMTQYSKNNILVQAAQSMLAQANSLPQGVLSLLQ